MGAKKDAVTHQIRSNDGQHEQPARRERPMFSRATLPIGDVTQELNKCRASIYSMMDPKSKSFDARFPKPLRIGGRRVWLARELETFVEALRADRDQRGLQ